LLLTNLREYKDSENAEMARAKTGPKSRGHNGRNDKAALILRHLGKRSIVLIGLMGAGKTAIGRRLATRLGLDFTDADTEIERAAGTSISDIFTSHGEEHFRAGEEKVITRLLKNGSQVLATGGGAYMNDETRKNIRRRGISVWLKADLDILLERVRRRDNRPLLKEGNPEEIMRRLMDERYPVYADAEITVQSRNVTHDVIVGEIISALAARAAASTNPGRQ